ncbi:MAG: hypothetical protein V3T17_14300 [Pseudomonadales bacterium]
MPQFKTSTMDPNQTLRDGLRNTKANRQARTYQDQYAGKTSPRDRDRHALYWTDIARQGVTQSEERPTLTNMVRLGVGDDSDNLIRMHAGPKATEACSLMGAEAYALGHLIAFRTPTPRKEDAEHEAGHALRFIKGCPARRGLSDPHDPEERDVKANGHHGEGVGGGRAVEGEKHGTTLDPGGLDKRIAHGPQPVKRTLILKKPKHKPEEIVGYIPDSGRRNDLIKIIHDGMSGTLKKRYNEKTLLYAIDEALHCMAVDVEDKYTINMGKRTLSGNVLNMVEECLGKSGYVKKDYIRAHIKTTEDMKGSDGDSNSNSNSNNAKTIEQRTEEILKNIKRNQQKRGVRAKDDALYYESLRAAYKKPASGAKTSDAGLVPPRNYGRNAQYQAAMDIKDTHELPRAITADNLTRAERFMNRIARMVVQIGSIHVAVALDGKAIVMSANKEIKGKDSLRTVAERLKNLKSGVDPLKANTRRQEIVFERTATDIQKMQLLLNDRYTCDGGIEMDPGVKKDLVKIKDAIEKGTISKDEYLAGDEGIYVEETSTNDKALEYGMHGELKVTKIIKDRRLNYDNSATGDVFIGGVLLDCRLCNAAHKLANDALTAVRILTWQFYTAGTHGGIYPWKASQDAEMDTEEFNRLTDRRIQIRHGEAGKVIVPQFEIDRVKARGRMFQYDSESDANEYENLEGARFMHTKKGKEQVAIMDEYAKIMQEVGELDELRQQAKIHGDRYEREHEKLKIKRLTKQNQNRVREEEMKNDDTDEGDTRISKVEMMAQLKDKKDAFLKALNKGRQDRREVTMNWEVYPEVWKPVNDAWEPKARSAKLLEELNTYTAGLIKKCKPSTGWGPDKQVTSKKKATAEIVSKKPKASKGNKNKPSAHEKATQKRYKRYNQCYKTMTRRIVKLNTKFYRTYGIHWETLTPPPQHDDAKDAISEIQKLDNLQFRAPP